MSFNRPADALVLRRTISGLKAPVVGTDWESPYRLMAGAAYSLCCASMYQDSRTLDFDWKVVDGVIDKPERWSINDSWGQTWLASYFITNAIFRIAAAAEKICGLRILPKERRLRKNKKTASTREVVRHALKKPKHGLHGRIPSLVSVFGPWGRHNIKKFLEDETDRVNLHHQEPDYPLLCCIYQTDRDKHVPYPPTKKPFFWEIAYRGFEQACTLYRDAAPP